MNYKHILSNELEDVLINFLQTDTFIDAAFAAVCINVTVLQAKLSSQHVESRENTSPSDVETLIHLCQQCECSLHFLKSCCDQKLFREFIVRNKVCSTSTVRYLILSKCMNVELDLSCSLYEITLKVT